MSIARFVIRVAGAAIVAVVPVAPVFAINPGPIGFPMIGLGLGQTLRINAVAINPGPIQTPLGCVADLSFADAGGNPVGVNPGPIQINLVPGQSTFLDLPASAVVARAGARAEVRPVVTFPPGDVATDCVFSAELFDAASGFSQVFQVFQKPPPSGAPPDPTAQPGLMISDFALMGVAFGQVARLNAVAVNPGPIGSPIAGAADVPPGPCVVSLGFADRNGNPVGANPGPQQVEPGHAVFLDFPASLMVRMFGQRAEVRPVVSAESVPGMAACAGVVSLVETFDVVTGRTWAAAQPGPIQ